MKTLSKTAAIRESAGYVSISGRRTDWHVYGPYRAEDLDGPSTEIHTCSYEKARGIATRWRASIVLALMGKLTLDADSAIEWHGLDVYADHSLRAYVDAGLKA